MPSNISHFNLIVIGPDADERVREFDNNKKVEQYVVYKYSEAKQIHKQYIQMLEKVNESNDTIKEELNYIKGLNDTDFFCKLSEGYELDKDGNAISTANPNGKYYSCRKAKDFAIPLITKDGKETFSCQKKDVDWKQVHLGEKQATYERVWEMVMEHSKPRNLQEENMYENMKNRTAYFNFFKTKENYVISNTAFWGYAILTDDNKWLELEDWMSQTEWVANFFDRFIKPLPDDALITIYECVKFKD